MWRPVFNNCLANIRRGVNIGANQTAAREIIGLVPESDEIEISKAVKNCKPVQDFDSLCQRIGGAELNLIDQARALREQYGFDEADLTTSIFHGVNDRLLTLRLWIGAGNLSYASEAHKLIQQHGDTERFLGEGKRSELLAEAITRGIETAGIKAEIAAREAEVTARKAVLDIGAGI